MADILAEAGVPAGVFNVVTGSGAALGDHLVSHPDVDKVAFTGSTEIGAHAASLAAKSLTPFTAELGGNAANIVFADADLDQAVHTVISAFVFNSGQFCMAGPRLLVERPIYDTVLGILGQAVPHVPFGDPRDPETVIGPLASATQRRKVSEMVERAKAAGATVVTGGSEVDLDGGFYYAPTVLAGLPDDAEAVAEEIFGPVLTVQPFDTEEEAISLANGTAYGLASGIQTRDLTKAHRVAAKLDAGITWVNGWALLDPSVPFGGVKASGWGREGGPEAMESYQRAHSIVFNLAAGSSPVTAGRAAVLEAPGELVVSDVDFAAPGAGEVLVKLVASGMCHTDLGAIAGGIPFATPGIIGHEGAGIVAAVGEGVSSVSIGDKVLLSFTSCGTCGACHSGHPAYCETWLPRNLLGELRADASGGVTRHGERIAAHFFGQSSFGEFSIADERSIVKVDADADLTVLAPLGCGVLTGFGSVWNVLDPQIDDIVAVYGTGAVGLVRRHRRLAARAGTAHRDRHRRRAPGARA